MKHPVQKSPISDNKAFDVRYLREPHFDPNWHFHPEYQLFLVLKGTGTRFIGDHVAPFREGDFVFTGPNLPHLWQSDPQYLVEGSGLTTEGIVVYLPENFLGRELLQKHEMFRIRELFAKADRGIEMYGKTREEAVKMIQSLVDAADFEKILTLLQLLHLLSTSTEYRFLATEGYSNQLTESETDRMTRVHAYVLKNFRNEIRLEDVAAIANMSPSAFSRYFKVHANKTFTDFVTEVRIGHSCQLLLNQKASVSEICYDSGFNTLSNFNRQFKAITHYTPLEYRRKYQMAS